MTTLDVSLSETRYDRQERISWWDQRRLSDACVLVAGAGALGNEIVKNLVLVGVGSIVVVDFDTIELSNLARCLFFRTSDEGAPKARTLATRARELNADVDVLALDRDVRTLGTGLARRADVLVGALDSREARLFVNRLAWRAGRPWVDGAIEALSGVARVFRPPLSCYECTLSEVDVEALAFRQSCRLLSRDDLLEGKVPTTATSASAVAAIQAQEVVKLLHADRATVVPLRDAIVLDGANNDAYALRYPFSDDCIAHHVFEDPIELGVVPDTTFADVAAAAFPGDGPSIVELGDDHLLAWRCTACVADRPAAGVVALATFDDAVCDRCGEPRQPVTTSAVEVPGSLAGATLTSCGTRANEVFAVRRGLEYHYVWARSPDPDLSEEWW